MGTVCPSLDGQLISVCTISDGRCRYVADIRTNCRSGKNFVLKLRHDRAQVKKSLRVGWRVMCLCVCVGGGGGMTR